MFSFFRGRRRQRWLESRYTNRQLAFARRNVDHFRRLSPTQASKLQGIATVLLHEKRWEGCDGLAVTEEMRITIATQAAIMLLQLTDYYFDRVRTMLVYPQTIRRDARYKIGGPGTGERHVIGEAWHEGAVVLSWPAVLQDCRDPDAIGNVVLHEMAHQIDRIDGEMAGSPPMPTRDAAERWERVAGREFEQLRAAADDGQPHLLDTYGAESRAEFFAVATETFYREPHAFATYLGELYNLLMELYQVDPRQWF